VGIRHGAPKRETQTSRELWARTVIQAIVDPAAPPWPQDVLETISGVKGMFMRIFRMDQWDWFTVYTQLGHPNRGLAKTIGEALADVRMAARDGDENGLRQAQKRLSEIPARRCLRFFLGELAVPEEPNAGWIYILSTREMPDLLKIGMTTRTVLERVREINNATGVAIPFGVRRCWRVTDPRQSEKLLHQIFDGDRRSAGPPGPPPTRRRSRTGPRRGTMARSALRTFCAGRSREARTFSLSPRRPWGRDD
jgi:hypothetical protein